MIRRLRRWRGCLGLASMLLLAAGVGQSQEKAAEPHGAAELNRSLREVINVGADLYNRSGDHVGCFRVYQGALLSVKPFLPPELQKKVDQAMTNADRLPTWADRAFELRAVIDEIRATGRPKASPPPVKIIDAPGKEEKKAEEKKAEEKKQEEKKTEESKTAKADVVPTEEGTISAKTDERVQLSGVATYDGQPVMPGYSVGLVAADERHYSAPVRRGGAYKFHTSLPAGQYRIQIETFEQQAPSGLPALPQRYRKADTSGLAVDLQAGARYLEIHLVK